MKNCLKLFIVIFITLFLLIGIVHAETKKIMKGGYVVALNESDLKIAFALIHSKESLLLMFDNKQIWPSKDGLEVYITEVGSHGRVKVRPAGSVLEVWTFQEALQ